MEQNTEVEGKSFRLSLSNAAQLASMAVALGIAFSVIRNYFYYVLLLHVPVFQYISLTDIVLIAPSGIFWAIYFSSMDAASWLGQSTQFDALEKFFYALLLYTFAGILFYVGFYNEPIVEQSIKVIWRHPWYLLFIVAYVLVRMRSKKRGNDFFGKNRYAAARFLCIWYAAFDSYASYSVLVNESRHVHLMMKMKNEKKLDVKGDLVYAGRTSTYWFIYNKKTKLVRAIKDDGVEMVDFDTMTR